MTHIGKMAAIVVLGLAGLVAMAPAHSAEQSAGYAYRDDGTVARDGTGDCIRTLQWSFANSISECDPDAVVVGLANAKTKVAAADVNLVAGFRVITETLQGGQEFAFDDDGLSPSARKRLDRLWTLHKRALITRIDVVGHTDRLGDEKYNLDLSKRRADKVKLYLMSKEIPEEIINVLAVGSSDALIQCDGFEGDALKRCLAPNRRTEVRYTVPFIRGGLVADLYELRATETEAGVKTTRTIVDVSNHLNGLWRDIGNSCRAELKTRCEATEPGEGRVMACLYNSYAALSRGCRADLNAAQKYIRGTIYKVKQAANSCGTDIATTCADHPPGSGGVLSCLIARRAKLETDCRDALIAFDFM